MGHSILSAEKGKQRTLPTEKKKNENKKKLNLK